MRKSTFSFAAALALPLAGAAQGQLLFDFESGLQNWGTSGFGNGTEFVGLSATGATEGSAQAMSFGHESGGFSWDASWVHGAPDPLAPVPDKDATYNLISTALASPAGKALEFDLTWRATGLETFDTFANISFSLQSDAGFKQVDGIGEINTAQDTTISVSLPLDSGNLAGSTPNSSFYRLTIGLNSDAGRGFSTGYVDNIKIVPEPASAAVFGLGSLAVLRRRRSA